MTVADQGAKVIARAPLPMSKATPSEGFNGPREADDSMRIEDLVSANGRPFTPQQNQKDDDHNESIGKLVPTVVQRSDNNISEM